MRSKSQILSKLRADGHITDEEYKVLEQEPVLDKIRAEIQKVINTERDFTLENAKAQAIALYWCLEIIDKYRQEG